MKTQHLIPILFLAAFCTDCKRTSNASIYDTSSNLNGPHHTGTVRYPSGEPAAGVHVTLYPGVYYEDDDYNYREAITDKDGHYDIIPPRKILTFHVGLVVRTNHVMARDFEKNYATVQAFSVMTTNWDLILQPAITLSGSVKNTAGAPVIGAELNLGFSSDRYGIEMRPPFKANKRGQFTIPALPQGIEYDIFRITAEGYGSSHADVKARDTETNHYEFPTFVLKPANRILAGRVLDSDGKPVAGAEVTFRGEGQPPDSKTETDDEGRFHTDTVCEGEIRVRAEFMGNNARMEGGGSAGIPVKAGDTNVIIKLRQY